MEEKIQNDFSDHLEEIKKNILQLSQTMCPFCILRFLNYSNIALFAAGQEEIFKQLQLIQPDVLLIQQCQACSNILCKLSQNEFKENLKSFILQSGFEYNQYLLNVTIPSYFIVNDAVLKHKFINQQVYFSSDDKYINKKPKGANSFRTKTNEIINIKKAAKFILGPYLTQQLAVPVHYLAYFRCEITVLTKNSINWTPEQLANLPKASRRHRNQNKDEQSSQKDFGLDAEVQRIVNENGWNVEMLRQMIENQPSPNDVSISLAIDRDPVYITGRYLKIQRGIAQTGDEVDASDDESNEKLPYAMNTILEPLFRKYVDFEKFVFHAAGREDIDVRMLGNGRPFICELQMAKNACRLDWKKIGQEIDYELEKNGNYLRIYQKELLVYEKHDDKLMGCLYQGGQEKIKNYRALCWAQRPIEQLHLENLCLKQKTPIRVLHRRSLLERDKHIYKLDLVKQYGNYFICDIKGSAGCYIKEFVHGDLGRTSPNLRQILNCECEILQLDVLGVEMQWPPPEVDTWIERVADK